MSSEYVFSARLIFWGDALNASRLEGDLHLDVSARKEKGEPLKRPDGTEMGSVAKTGMLSCELAPPGSSLRREPEPQLLVAAGALKQLEGSLADTYNVTDAQLQVFIYYENKVSGEPDFTFPSELLDLMVRHGIGLAMTILP